MAIRFTSFEAYKRMLADKETGSVTGKATFLAGLAAGVTEAVAVVTPMEVVKIRLQGQYHSMADPLDVPKYRNAAHALFTVLREEGIGALWRGVSLTALRQGSNQAVNFTAYTEFKEMLQKWQPETEGFHAFYKGITPRIMRVAPGQAVTFTVYEFLKEKLESSNIPYVGGKYEE
ncbi:putative Succinate/fumarate mitochondrial transporter [Glarea lozoyensis 74030]|uniref:Putative Succinate/fumarate mitochondrial transporter n=1 Tax=Glarea lozoyensis (strain ATCC 74030 / MF5533) TaxID=1104152 RepID=H0EJ86_GLAL7|nr:putative Succinate/fumarate mitochondrial transporter [Glarea lozoyensis 74030]